ncbi:hypothetical protein CSC82_33540 [Rhodobacteraceae bacterium 4F10]|nr:hypothetical protein CSC82_33540 [Rhodobacteraceae bacterium 4F10]
MICLIGVMSFLGFYYVKSEKEKDTFTKFQKIILLIMILIPSYVLIHFTYIYTGSLKNVFINSLFVIALLASIFYQKKKRHDLFLVGVIAILMSMGFLLGKEFAANRFNEKEYVDIFDMDKNIEVLKVDEIVIGQNSSDFIIINKVDTTHTFIRKKDGLKVSFKGRIN